MGVWFARSVELENQVALRAERSPRVDPLLERRCNVDRHSRRAGPCDRRRQLVRGITRAKRTLGFLGPQAPRG